MALLRHLLPLLLALPGATSLALPQHHAVVVGAGPVGIAAALSLASHHNYTVTLLESSPESSSQSQYDPTKAFLYNVNRRGQTLTKQFPNVHRKLQERSVASGGFGDTVLTIVPADPDAELPEKKKNMEGTTKEEKADEKKGDLAASLESEKAAARGYWIPRHEMVKLMTECIAEHNAQSECKIDFLLGRECVSVLPTKKVGQNAVCVTARNVKDGSLKLHQASLVVGADGMNSKVRQCLATAPSNLWNSHRGFKPKKFHLKKWTSPASHMRIKVLQLPPQFEIPNAPGLPPLTTFSEDIYAIRSANTGPRTYLSLGLLPMKDNDAVRPTNIVTRPDHEVWTIKEGPAMREYFQKAFPRFNFEKDTGMISETEWERFAKAEGTRFPYCQYSPGLSVWDESGTCGVALVGDAIHAFPPDIGQGVNAGLMDVVSLDRALQGQDPETGEEVAASKEEMPTLKGNLERYQKRHAPEIAALIRLARFGAPYQYKQPHRPDRALRMLWTANVAMRMILSKLTFGVIQPPGIILSQNKELTFRQLMRRADRTTALLWTALVGLLGRWAVRQFAFPSF